MKDRKKYLGGFTILELLVTVAIIGILAALVIFAVSESQSKGRDARRNRDVHEIRTALNLYKTDNGFYPTDGTENFTTIDGNDYVSEELIDGGHISEISADPINTSPHTYEYRPLGTGFQLQYCLESSPDDCVILEP